MSEMSKAQAQEVGDKIAGQLGDGWTVELDENLGWHCCVVSPCRRYTVFPSAVEGKFVAFLGESARWTGVGDSPRGAVREVQEVALKEIRYLSYLVENPPNHFGAE